MTESGRKAVAGAQANGSWTRFDLAEQLVLSEELSEILSSDSTFAAHWNRLTDARKRQYLQQIYDAKKEVTRRVRIEQIRKAIQDSFGDTTKNSDF